LSISRLTSLHPYGLSECDTVIVSISVARLPSFQLPVAQIFPWQQFKKALEQNSQSGRSGKTLLKFSWYNNFTGEVLIKMLNAPIFTPPAPEETATLGEIIALRGKGCS